VINARKGWNRSRVMRTTMRTIAMARIANGHHDMALDTAAVCIRRTIV
jgi:hypothetical protein